MGEAKARRTDPASSHEAAEAVQPTLNDRERAVIETLETARALGNLWVPGPVLASEEVGGSEGLRRLRDLRATGILNYEKRRMAGSTAWEYRLAPR